MEETMHQSFKKRNELITNRRQNDVKDEAEEVSGKTNAGRIKIVMTIMQQIYLAYT